MGRGQRDTNKEGRRREKWRGDLGDVAEGVRLAAVRGKRGAADTKATGSMVGVGAVSEVQRGA